MQPDDQLVGLLFSTHWQGYFTDWHIGVRVKSNGKLVAFITGIPANIRVLKQTITMAGACATRNSSLVRPFSEVFLLYHISLPESECGIPL